MPDETPPEAEPPDSPRHLAANPHSSPRTPHSPAVLLFFVLVSALFTWPLVTHMSDTLPDWGDAADSTWRIGNISRQLATDPLHLYETPSFYPIRNGLALDELLTGQGLLAAPVIWLSSNPVLAYNLLNFLSYVLSGYAMWLLVRHLTGSSLAGLGAGLVFAFSPWHYGQYGHLGLGAQFWMVFALYFLMRYLWDVPASRRGLFYLALFGVCAALQALVAGYYAFFQAILFGFYLTYYFLIERGVLRWVWRQLRHAGGTPQPEWRELVRQAGIVALAGGAALAMLVPFVLPFAEAKSQTGFQRGLDEVVYWSAGPKSLLRTTTHSWLYEPVQKGVFGLETSAEREMYPGLAVTLLALLGLAGSRHRGKLWLFAAVSALGLLLSFGPYLNIDAYGQEPTGLPLPYKWLYEHVPGFDSLRVPQRFGMLFMLGLAVCAGYGLAWLSKRRGWSRSGAVVAVLLVALEFAAAGLPAVHTAAGMNESGTAPPVYAWLAGEEARAHIGQDDLLLELPVGLGEDPINTNPIYMVYSLAHERPMLNGSSNIVPPGYQRLFSEMRRFPTPNTLDIIEGLGVRYLVVHTGGLLNEGKREALRQEAGPGGRLELVQSFPDIAGFPPDSRAEIYRLIPSPQRYIAMRSAIPPGARVLLADHPARLRLFNAVLPRLLGPDRLYFANFSTVYDAVTGERAPAAPGQTYDYLIMYTGDDPAKYGFSAEKSVYQDPDGIVEVYEK